MRPSPPPIGAPQDSQAGTPSRVILWKDRYSLQERSLRRLDPLILRPMKPAEYVLHNR